MNRRTALKLLPLSAAPVAAIAGPDEKALLALLEKWRVASLAGDRKTLESIIDPNCLYSHSNARLETGTEQIEAAVTGKPKYEKLEVSAPTVREHGSNAVIRCNMAIRTNNAGTVNNLNLNVLTVWNKQGGNWKMIARQSTRLPD